MIHKMGDREVAHFQRLKYDILSCCITYLSKEIYEKNSTCFNGMYVVFAAIC